MNFITYKAMIDIGFWSRLTKKKVEEYKLDASPKPLVAKFRLSNKPDKMSILSINAYSFGDTTDEEKSGPI